MNKITFSFGDDCNGDPCARAERFMWWGGNVASPTQAVGRPGRSSSFQTKGARHRSGVPGTCGWSDACAPGVAGSDSMVGFVSRLLAHPAGACGDTTVGEMHLEGLFSPGGSSETGSVPRSAAVGAFSALVATLDWPDAWRDALCRRGGRACASRRPGRRSSPRT